MTESLPPASSRAPDRDVAGRLALVGGVVAVVLAVVGYFAGVRATAESVLRHGPDEAPRASGGARVPRYEELGLAPRGPNRDRYEGALAALAPSASPPEAPEPAELRRQLLEARASRRAYDGAPPGVPHAVDEQSTASCPACHERGARIGDRIAPAMSHGPRPSCTQCHAPARTTEGLPSNGFVGLPSPGPGRRAWPGAPPTVPHAVDLRGNCESCHGPTGLAGIRTPHPDRRSCTQCHVPERGGPAR